MASFAGCCLTAGRRSISFRMPATPGKARSSSSCSICCSSTARTVTALPLVDRKARLQTLLNGAPSSLQYNDHQIGHGPAFHRLACEHGLEGIVSKRINGRYESDRRTWLKTKCLNREEFVVVGWSDPEGSRHRIGSLLLGYYTSDDKLIYSGRVGTGMPSPSLSGCGGAYSRLRLTRRR